jgi:putative toxin-antitoxin system antitoxin component (TIGR02293 family)
MRRFSPVSICRVDSGGVIRHMPCQGAANGGAAMMPSVVMGLSYLDVARGVPSGIVRQMEQHGLTRDDIRMIIADRTLERRLAAGEPLKVEEGDALARLLRIVTQARAVFGDAALADEWLRSANPALGGGVPIRMARTDLGGREVEAVLGRIAHGVFG